jgi:hypothetical protein
MSNIPMSIKNIDINSSDVTNVKPLVSESKFWTYKDNEIQFDYKGITYTGEVVDGIVEYGELLFIEKYYEY